VYAPATPQGRRGKQRNWREESIAALAKLNGCGVAVTALRKEGPKRAYFVVFPCATQYRLEQKKRIRERY
jgi:hypothetical protein